MNEQDFNAAVAIVICSFIALTALVIFAQAYTSKPRKGRASKPRNRRVGLPEPSRDAKRYATPQAVPSGE